MRGALAFGRGVLVFFTDTLLLCDMTFFLFTLMTFVRNND